MNNKVSLTLCFGIIIILSSGCATMIHGTTQKIEVKTEPSGAKVAVRGESFSTPGSVTLDRGLFYTCVISKEGYKTEKVNLQISDSKAIYVSLLSIATLVGPPISILIDTKTGGRFNQSPDSVAINLVKKEQATSTLASSGKDIITRPDLTSSNIFERLEDKNKVRICCFYTNGGLTPEIRILDGEDAIAVLKERNFICWERRPGNTTIVADSMMSDRKATNVMAEGGKTYFFQSFNQNNPLPVLVDIEKAKGLAGTHVPVEKGNYVPFD